MWLSIPSPHTHRHSPSLLTSVLCRAGLQVLLLLRGRGSRGSGLEPDVLSSVAARDWAPGCVLGGVWATSLPCLLFIPSWADPSMGMLTWSLHWASRARGWWSNPSLREVDGVSPSSATSIGQLCNDSDCQPALLGVFQAGPGQYGCCFCPLELLLPAETCVCSDTHPGGRRPT